MRAGFSRKKRANTKEHRQLAAGDNLLLSPFLSSGERIRCKSFLGIKNRRWNNRRFPANKRKEVASGEKSVEGKKPTKIKRRLQPYTPRIFGKKTRGRFRLGMGFNYSHKPANEIVSLNERPKKTYHSFHCLNVGSNPTPKLSNPPPSFVFLPFPKML